ncbi:MAG: hypothetical protein JF588_06715 [Caulobacterales bacterium]|nr:hypothetical protein [Caulobacterales bacterium]
MDDIPTPLFAQGGGLVSRVLGAALALTGLGCIATVFAANYGRSHAAETLAFRLGLAFAPLISAVGLCLVLIGVAVFWRAGRQR